MNALENLHNKTPEELSEIVQQLHGELNAHKKALHESHQVIESLRYQLNNSL